LKENVELMINNARLNYKEVILLRYNLH